MGEYLRHEYEAESGVSKAAVRDALSALSEDDVSSSSPVSAGGQELAVDDTGDGALAVICEGHGGDWTKTSEEAVRVAVQSVDGVGDLVGSEGGYDAE